MSKHLVVDITAHGFGHVAQTTAVLNALHTLNPDLNITIRTTAPQRIFDERLPFPIKRIAHQQDTGMIMHNALHVDAEASFEWYQAFHATYPQRLRIAAQQLDALKPDLLFANVPYLSLDAAHTLGLPSLALCSLNWADVFHAYCGNKANAQPIYQQMLTAYNHAECFMQASPSMPMPNLSNTCRIAPIAAKGSKQAGYLRKLIQADENARFILIGLGGIGIDFPLQQWPSINNVFWLFPDESLSLQREDCLPQSIFGLPYFDLLAHCDLLLTKTGYGSQAEAVINQIPSICIHRNDWPEQPYLFEWHKQHGEVSFITWDALISNQFIQHVEYMLEKPWRKEAVQASGAEEAATIMNRYLT